MGKYAISLLEWREGVHVMKQGRSLDAGQGNKL
jgi:hypothetical protein